MPSGGAVTNVTIATSETWKDKQTGQPQERTEWHRVVFFNRLAEIAGEYLKKGSKVYVEGSLRTRKWQDQVAKTVTPPRLLPLKCKCSTAAAVVVACPVAMATTATLRRRRLSSVAKQRRLRQRRSVKLLRNSKHPLSKTPLLLALTTLMTIFRSEKCLRSW
jgi:hypothetical protein